MCQSIYYNQKRYSSVGELVAVAGRENVVPCEGELSPDHCCLCCVDVAETAWNLNCRAFSDCVNVEFVPFGKQPAWGEREMKRRLCEDAPKA
jgi:hypothetical protein